MWRSAVLLLAIVFALPVLPGRVGPEPLTSARTEQDMQAGSFPNTADGIQGFVDEILRAVKAKDSARETALIRSLLIPEDSTWLVAEYGPGFGASLKAAYERLRPELEREMRTVYEGNVQRGWTSPNVFRYADPEAVNAPLDHFLNCMNQIVPLYGTAFQGNSAGHWFSLEPGKNGTQVAGDLDGYFMYDRGGFRFLPMDILMKLPNERPIRIQLDMRIMESKLIEKVPIRVPQEAIEKHIGGQVVVEVSLGVNGNTQSVKALEGDPILTLAVIDAVKQWRFGPTTLDGDPVEVAVRVPIIFDIR